MNNLSVLCLYSFLSLLGSLNLRWQDDISTPKRTFAKELLGNLHQDCCFLSEYRTFRCSKSIPKNPQKALSIYSCKRWRYPSEYPNKKWYSQWHSNRYVNRFALILKMFLQQAQLLIKPESHVMCLRTTGAQPRSISFICLLPFFCWIVQK